MTENINWVPSLIAKILDKSWQTPSNLIVNYFVKPQVPQAVHSKQGI